MMTKTQRWSTPASGSSDGTSRPLGKAAVDAAKRVCMIRGPRRAWLVGLGLGIAVIFATGGSAGANDRLSPVPTCSSPASSRSPFIILDNQTYALCAASSCFVFNEVAYCKCDVEFGDSISEKLAFDNGQDVCTVNREGVTNGYMVSTFSPPPSNPHQAIYTCPGVPPGRAGSNGAYAQCDGGICFKSTQGQSFPGFDEPLAKDEIMCSCPITQEPVSYQIAGPYPCQQSFFENCSSAVANNHTGSTLFVGAPTGTFDLLSRILNNGQVPRENRCPPP